MAKKMDDAIVAHPANREHRLDTGAMQALSLKELRKAAQQTQEDMAAALGVGQDTISRLEKRSDMLLSTLQHYVECVGGKLELVVTFPDRPTVVIDRCAHKRPTERTTTTHNVADGTDPDAH